MENYEYIERNIAQQIDDIIVEHFAIIDSTNNYLLEKKFTSKYNFCYADIQTKARGRRGNTWISQSKDNVYASLGFNCNFNISKNLFNSIKIALIVLKTIQQYIIPEQKEYINIKLPNDIYFKDYKLAGILIETKNIKKESFDIVIGVGINVNMSNLNGYIDREWTSLSIINNSYVDSSQIIVLLVNTLISLFNRYDSEVLVDLAKYDYTFDKKIIFNYDNQLIQGVAKGVSKDLKLNILRDNKLFKFDLANLSKIRVLK